MRRRTQLLIVPKGGLVCSIQSLMYRLRNWPISKGNTTVMDNWPTMDAKGTADEEPRNTSSKNGVTNIPRKLPNAELKIAAASFPPTAFVRITAEDTGGGIQPTTRRPFRSHSFKLLNSKSFTNSEKKPGTKANVKPWTKRCNLTLLRALFNSSDFKDSPLFKKMAETAIYLTVISGLRIPPFAPIKGANLARQITTTIPIKNQFFWSFANIFFTAFECRLPSLSAMYCHVNGKFLRGVITRLKSQELRERPTPLRKSYQIKMKNYLFMEHIFRIKKTKKTTK